MPGIVFLLCVFDALLGFLGRLILVPVRAMKQTLAYLFFFGILHALDQHRQFWKEDHERFTLAGLNVKLIAFVTNLQHLINRTVRSHENVMLAEFARPDDRPLPVFSFAEARRWFATKETRVHLYKGCSARARRQGPVRLDRSQKRQNNSMLMIGGQEPWPVFL